MPMEIVECDCWNNNLSWVLASWVKVTILHPVETDKTPIRVPDQSWINRLEIWCAAMSVDKSLCYSWRHWVWACGCISHPSISNWVTDLFRLTNDWDTTSNKLNCANCLITDTIKQVHLNTNHVYWNNVTVIIWPIPLCHQNDSGNFGM